MPLSRCIPLAATLALLVLPRLLPVAPAGAQTASATAGTPVLAWPDELSGIARLGASQLLLVDDEERRHVFIQPRHSSAKTLELRQVELPLSLDDLEAATSDGLGRVYLLTSHSVSKKGKLRPERRRLVRLPADPSAWASEVKVVLDLRQRLAAAIEPLIQNAEHVNLNLEGLAWYPAAGLSGALCVGARSPLAGGHALVFEIEPVDALFTGEAVAVRAFTLDLGGRGVRGLAHDPYRDGVLVLAGAVRGDEPTPAIYLWRPRAESAVIPLLAPGLERLPQPEAILAMGPLDGDGRGPILVVTEGTSSDGSPVVELIAGQADER